jgi:hypothetical protein
MTWLRSSVTLIALTVSCTGTSTEESGSTQALCDGSTSARLSYLSSGGQVDQDYEFYGVYGHAAFVVDGQCRFWVSGSPLEGLRTGTLDGGMADEIARKLHRGSLVTLSRQRDTQSCPDAGELLIGDGTHAINCSCGCDAGLPAATKEAFANVDAIYRSLQAMGGPYDGPLRAVSIREDAGVVIPSRVLPWTLALRPADLLLEGPWPKRDSGKAIDAPADRTELRKLRTMAIPLQTGAGFHVRDSDDTVFRILTRDEAPQVVTAALAVH